MQHSVRSAEAKDGEKHEQARSWLLIAKDDKMQGQVG